MSASGPSLARWTYPLIVLLLAGVLPLRTLAAAPQRGTKLTPPMDLRCQDQAQALAVAEPHPELSWRVEPVGTHANGVRVSGYQIEVAGSRGDLTRERRLVWDSGRAAVEFNDLPATHYQGQTLEPGKRYWWRVRAWDGAGSVTAWSEAAQFAAAPRWHAAWIAAAATDAEAGKKPMPLFRKSFTLDAPVRRAVLHMTGLGQYEAHINGAKVGRQELAPGWSDYRKTVFYDSLDVTRMLQAGANVLGVMLGNGMLRVQQSKGRYTKFEASYGPPELTAQLAIELVNGKTLEILSDASWKTAEGPIVFSSPYGGEDYDARREIAGWDAAHFADGAWAAAKVVEGPGGVLRPEMAADLGPHEALKPLQQRTIRPAVVVYDLGENIAGWPRLTATGPAGSTVKLIGGELLNADGTVSQRSTGKPQWFTYTLKGAGLERWHPRFSYWGFRYLQVETAGGARVTELRGQPVHSNAEQAGAFSASNELLTRIHLLILRAMANNAMSVLTDCPHREKLGWLEQTHLLAPSLLDNFDLRGMYRALGQNLADGQKADGAVPEIVPQYVVFNDKWGPFNDSPEWGSAVVLAPWYVYQRTGDREQLLVQRESMRRYVNYLSTRAENGIVRYGLGDWYDIGPKPPGVAQLTTAGLTATAIYYQDLTVLARVLELAGDQAASRHYAEQAASVREAFNRTFFDYARHRYDRGSQTAQAMPLALGMEPEGQHAAVLKALVEDIAAHQDHVTAGDIGYRYVVDALTANDRSDVLLRMLERQDAPSYGYQLAQGATALTEAWDANPANSQDHFMLGDAEHWFYAVLGGIQIDHTAARDQQLVIAPEVLGDVTWVDCVHDTTWGRVESNWRMENGVVHYALVVPVNTVATVRIVTAKPAEVLVNAARPETAEGVLQTRPTERGVELRVGSGNYRIQAAAPTTDSSR